MCSFSIARIAVGIVILAAWGCQSTPSTGGGGPSRDVPTAPSGTPAELLQRAEAAPAARRSPLYLEAAEAFIAVGALEDAALALNGVDPDRLNGGAVARYLLATGQVALARGAVPEARAALAALDETDLADPLQAVLLRADVESAAGRPDEAASALMTYDGALDDTARQQVNDAIWGHLAQVDPYTAMARERESSGAARSWWQLRTLMFDSLTLAEQQRRLGAWRESHPGHPAESLPPAALLPAADEAANVQQVALLLPLSGPLGRAGKAVRDAFIATYLLHRDDVGYQVTIHDVAAEPLPALYERLLGDGTDVIVGPLSKPSVAQLNQLAPEIPALALNYLDDQPPAANVLQLGLAIEDEATTLEEWLNGVGVERLLVLHNAEDWALRARSTLADAWKHPITIQAVEDIRTITESVGVAMHVAASQDRRDALEELLGESLEFLPRARGDVDAIVALVTQIEASALVPALKYHFADEVPVYATSQTVRGADAAALRELEGFRVSELPWFTHEFASYQALRDAFGLDGSPFAALYALGVDAFRLTERAPRLLAGNDTAMLGSTGVLEFLSDGRIQRHLARTVVHGGKLVEANAAPGR